jgi:CHAD domain-containing protein
MAFDEPADRATATVLLDLLGAIEAHFEGTLEGRDPEALHDLRVAVRRTRAIQRQCRGVFPPRQLAHLRAEFRWLQRTTGPARDMVVYLTGFGELRALVPASARGDLQPLLALLVERRRRARLELARALRSQRTSALLASWASLLAGLQALPSDDRPDADMPVGVLTGARIGKLYRRITRMGGHIGPAAPTEAYHELRKQGKELRYMLELFAAPLYPEEVVTPMIKTLKALQDALGRHQDRHVQAELLRSLQGELEPAPGAAVALLIARLERDALKARRLFAKRFQSFASPKQRRLVERTFSYS